MPMPCDKGRDVISKIVSKIGVIEIEARKQFNLSVTFLALRY